MAAMLVVLKAATCPNASRDSHYIALFFAVKTGTVSGTARSKCLEP
jgi:hypothetical protein